jgi:hypothetical protein
MKTKKYNKSQHIINPNNISLSDVPDFSDDSKYNSYNNPLNGGGLFRGKSKKTKKKSKSKETTGITPKQKVEAFILYIYTYNPNEVKQLDDNNYVLEVLNNLAKYKSIYEYLHKTQTESRMYNVMPLMKHIIRLYKKLGNNYADFFAYMHKYICIVSIFENIIYNAMYSKVSNTFSVEHKSHVKYALEHYEQYNNKEIVKIVNSHNKQFLSKFNCRVSITVLRKINPDKIYEEAKKAKSKPEKLNLSSSSFLREFMSVPGVEDFNPPSQTKSDKENDKDKTTTDKLTTLYLGIINTKLLKTKDPETKFNINTFYDNKYTYINW